MDLSVTECGACCMSRIDDEVSICGHAVRLATLRSLASAHGLSTGVSAGFIEQTELRAVDVLCHSQAAESFSEGLVRTRLYCGILSK